jgi:hypothetical protein
MRAGDRIVIEPKKALQPGRAGVIEEVLQEDPARVLVRWEDGHTSILTPAAGVARITPGTARKTSAGTKGAAKAKTVAKPKTAQSAKTASASSSRRRSA